MKNTYTAPTLDRILLDHEISLIMTSGYIAPGDPEATLFQDNLIVNDLILNDGVIGLF
jgi:hypothetical protein